MDEVTDFLDDVLPKVRDEVVALENGAADVRKSLWSHRDPLTLFGAEASAVGWDQVDAVFDRLAARFSDGQSCTYEVWRAALSGDLGHVVAIERSVAGTRGSAQRPFALRVTTIFRREQGDWKVIHRHGDPYDAASRAALDLRRQNETM
jgi:ketosteroid isomerase-like protein